MELAALLEKLKLEYLEPQLDTVCEQAAARELDYKSFLTGACLFVKKSTRENALVCGCVSIGTEAPPPGIATC